MSDNSAIEWTDATWNPVTGCTEVSPGCDICYAKTFAERWRGTPGHYFENGFDVQLRPDKLELPLKWRKPRKVFVNSMSDLFHKDVPDDYIARAFAVMARTPQHTYQVLTKRHGRLRALLSSDLFRRSMYDALVALDYRWITHNRVPWPLPNVWLGVSVEDQQRADLRIPALLETPAAVRFLSCEPLLGPVSLTREGWLLSNVDNYESTVVPDADQWLPEPGGIHWVIVGGESGHGARPMYPDWARKLRDQCTTAGVPFLFKQWGEYRPPVDGDERGAPYTRVGKKAAGRELDGRTWDEFPEVPA